MYAFLSRGGVYDQVDLSVGDHIQNIRPPFIKFFHPFRRNACRLDHTACFAGRKDAEPAVGKSSGDFCHFRFIPPVDGDEYGAFQGKAGLSRFLGFVKRFPVIRREPQNFSGGAHFRSQKGIDLREHIEREYSFFYPVIWNRLLCKSRNRRRPSGEFACNNVDGQRHHADVAHF